MCSEVWTSVAVFALSLVLLLLPLYWAEQREIKRHNERLRAIERLLSAHNAA